MAKLYVPNGSWLACDNGTSPSTLRVSHHEGTSIYAQPMATEADKIPFFNIKPMGLCKMKGFSACMPLPIMWEKVKEGVKINGNRMLLEDSTCKCGLGGTITIHFDRASAVAAGLGPGKMPTDYIKEGFDWVAGKNEEGRNFRDSFLPDWMKPVAHVGDWMGDLGTGLVEGAVNGVVGLGETIYQVGQDPVGTAEALGGMISDGWNATTSGAATAWNWASDGDNWSQAASDSWNWASNGDNWTNAASSAWEGTKDAAGWVADNPRKIGTTVGEFIPDAAAAIYSGGTSLGASAGKKALREGGEEIVERAAREGLEEAGEAAASRTAREVLEELAENQGDDIARVITRSADDIQDDILARVRNGELELTTSARKGNFGEMATDRDLMGNGHTPLHDRVTDIDAATKHGLDGVYRNANPPPDYLIVDAKYGSAGLNTLEDGTRQMSDTWIDDRLDDAVGRDVAREIRASSYERVVAKVDETGNIVYRKVDANGFIIPGKNGNWP